MRRAAGRREAAAGQMDATPQRSASPYLLALETKGGPGLPGAPVAGPSVGGGVSAAPASSSMMRHDGKAPMGQHHAATAARLQAAIARANHVTSGNRLGGMGGSGGRVGGGGGGAAPRRPASAMQHRRSHASAERQLQRSASAMGMREHLTKASAAATAPPAKLPPMAASGAPQGPPAKTQGSTEASHGLAALQAEAALAPDAIMPPGAAATPAVATAARMHRAASRLGRPPGGGAGGQQAEWMVSAVPLPQPAPLGVIAVSSLSTAVSRPSSAAYGGPWQQPPQQPPLEQYPQQYHHQQQYPQQQQYQQQQYQQQLPSLEGSGGRPPSRMQQYAEGGGAAGGNPARPKTGSGMGAAGENGQPRQAAQLPPVRPFSANRSLSRSRSMSVGLNSGTAAAAAAAVAAADAEALFVLTTEVRQLKQQQQQEQQQQQQCTSGSLAVEAQRAEQLRRQLAAASAGPDLQAAADSAVAWLSTQLPSPPAVTLLRQLVAVLVLSGIGPAAGPSPSSPCAVPDRPHRRSTSSGGAVLASAAGACSACGASPGGQAAAAASAAAAGSQHRTQQLFQQCSALKGEKAAQERLNQELSTQVQAYQQQLSDLHLRVDNLLQERQRLQEEAGEQAAAQANIQAEAAQLRQQLAAAEAVSVRGAGSSNAGKSGGGAGGARGVAGSASGADLTPARGTARASARSVGGAGDCSGRLPMESHEEEDVSWGRSLTGRAPAARPQNVPPVDLSRLRSLLPKAGR